MILSISYLNKGYNHPSTQVDRWSCLFTSPKKFSCLQSLPPFTLIIIISSLAVDNSWMSKSYTGLEAMRFVVILFFSRIKLHSLEPAAEKALSAALMSIILTADSYIVPLKRSCQGNLSLQLEKSNFLGSLSQFHGGLWRLWERNCEFNPIFQQK